MFKYVLFDFKSTSVMIKMIINIINNGIDNMLYDMAFLKFNLSIELNALVIPHDGHGI